MVHHAVFLLNMFPRHNRVLTTLSPQSIITGKGTNYNKHCKYEFGQYVQLHDQNDNSMLPCTTGVITLCLTGNAQGNFLFLSLTTGWILNQVIATPLPMQDNVIVREETLAR